MDNFNYPYISKSITEFWRRWHISLSSWFRDYVYIPLGGNRVPKGRWFFNIFVVWFLTGFWHGAAWNFIAWGLGFAIILVIEKMWLLKQLEQDLNVGYPYAKAMASEKPDRGALRCQVWSERVTRMLQSLLTRYAAEGDRMLENTGVYVCSICGFVYVGDAAPEMCPVCKVPSWKFDKMEGRV